MTETTPNLRDIGDLPAGGGRRIAKGRVLRSAVPEAADVGPDGLTWPPPLVIDLRSPGEADAVHPLTTVGSRVVNLPLLSALRPGVAPVDTLHDLYLLMLDQAAALLVDLVREVAAAEGTTLIHCAAGKDRTGVSIALLLRLVGVGHDDVIADYLLTAEAEREISARLNRAAGAEHRRTLPAAFFDVSPEAIVGVLAAWDEHPDGPEGWFLSVGGSSDDVDRLRRTLLA